MAKISDNLTQHLDEDTAYVKFTEQWFPVTDYLTQEGVM